LRNRSYFVGRENVGGMEENQGTLRSDVNSDKNDVIDKD
jgi:hypothetical protein